MKRFQPPSNLNQRLPNLRLLYPGSSLQVLINKFHKVPASRKFHHYTEISRQVVIEGFLEFNDVLVVDRSQNSDLIECVFFLLLFHSCHSHFLQSVQLVVLFTSHLIYLTERPLPNLFYYLKIFDVPLVTLHIIKIIITMGPYLAQPNLQKTSYKAENSKLKMKFARCEMQGWRRTMEDAAISQLDIGGGNSIFGVFDGHGGIEVSKFVEKIFIATLKSLKQYKQEKYKQALSEAFRKVDEIIQSKQGQEQLKIIRKKYDAASYSDGTISSGTGCTACVVLLTQTKIYTANAGDSRAVLCRKGHALPLSSDHKPQNEAQRKRIQAAGGDIVNGRVNGGLNLSRSFGDFNYKKVKGKNWDEQPIICKPDVSEINRQPDDQFIIMGCDGIWEKYVNDSQPMITRVSNELKTGNQGSTILKNLLDSLVAKQTSQETGCDNMTSLLIQFL